MESLVQFIDKKIDALEERVVKRIDKLEEHVDGIRMSKAKAAGAMAAIGFIMSIATHVLLAWYEKSPGV